MTQYKMIYPPLPPLLATPPASTSRPGYQHCPRRHQCWCQCCPSPAESASPSSSSRASSASSCTESLLLDSTWTEPECLIGLFTKYWSLIGQLKDNELNTELWLVNWLLTIISSASHPLCTLTLPSDSPNFSMIDPSWECLGVTCLNIIIIHYIKVRFSCWRLWRQCQSTIGTNGTNCLLSN